MSSATQPSSKKKITLKVLDTQHLPKTEPTLDDLLSGRGTHANPPTGLDFSAATNVDYIKLRHHVSYSEIASWMECAHRHKLKYLDEIKMEADGPSEHTEFGQVAHDALEIFLKTRIMPSTESLKAQLSEMFSKLDNATKLKEADWHDTLDPILSEVPAFMDTTFGSDWKFVAAELPLMEAIDGHSHMFKGFIDAIIEGKNKRGETVIYLLDWKTCSYFWPMQKRIDPKKTFQLVFYKHFYAKKMGIPLENIKTGFVLLRRSKKPGNCEFVPVSVGPKTLTKALETIDTMLGYVQKRMFPKNRDACTYCAFKNTEHCK